MTAIEAQLRCFITDVLHEARDRAQLLDRQCRS